jgi:cell wall-associated NlpC family hydrolase
VRLFKSGLILSLFIACFVLFLAVGKSSAFFSSGGLSIKQTASETPGQKAKLSGKFALAPKTAPVKIKRMIRAGNRITNKPYLWGGGHGSLRSSGYDCSGAVSYLLRSARIIKQSYTSGSFSRLGHPGKGQWVTIYANSGHVFMYVAGLRWDTAYITDGDKSGPGWSKKPRPKRGYAVRHFKIS